MVIRGDHDLNEIKAEKHPLIAAPLTFATPEQVFATCGANIGSIGPVGLDIPVIVDHAAAHVADFVCGANEDDKHLTGVNWGRDLNEGDTADLRNVLAGDPSPDGQGTLEIARGIEVGHIFQLGDNYSKKLNANVLGESGKSQILTMGCYGIGVSRVVAAAIEQNHDEKGIIWPRNLAPFEVIIIPVNFKNDDLKNTCESLYTQLKEMGVEVILDDRQDRLGGKLKDADLIGIPLQIIVGPKNLEEGKVEIKIRKTQESQMHPYPQIVNDIPNILKDL